MRASETEFRFTDTRVRSNGGIPSPRDFAFPVVRPERITSQFGPRWKSTEERYDFHRGIDFYGTHREPIFCIGAGIVFRFYREGGKVYPNGGNTLVIRHELAEPLDFHGHRVTRLFSLYLHLDEVFVTEGERVSAGQHVAAMGASGSTRFTHLHFEVRLATTCSLEYQRKHPRNAAAVYGFDPHVHPFLFIPGARSGQTAITHEGGSPFVVNFHASRGDLNLNRIRSDAGVVDFNERKGIDAGSTCALDDLDYGWMRLMPQRFSGRNREMVYRCEFPERPAFVEFSDIHGGGVRRDFR
jgi:murein DD-endopeptidase MepM/ murein hydrolase activator NlpD